jgi:hypothetical protein
MVNLEYLDNMDKHGRGTHHGDIAPDPANVEKRRPREQADDPYQ